ncbi:MAG: sulfur carrier protein ThiS [Acidobacteria bacterium]|nr:sulfur carrier protein ThiS [Acidobacteriota bacterium]NIM60641.1 sulfur carrier protein ThiS [Acidobacteriota bacterium]NIO57928.1 sulfur carrier protein ThiS [Acidobacteriota bacterium]NIQ28931.1 sulfur carrier protein ThiS [Acidobacteriota bacterium]NIQ83405.1 sulfur carrier protein ThiS [Acidobacteriota bacterium]
MDARRIRLNGEPFETGAATLVDLLRQLELGETAGGVAVAVNGTVIPRSDWSGHVLQVGDRVELVGAVQGG